MKSKEVNVDVDEGLLLKIKKDDKNPKRRVDATCRMTKEGFVLIKGSLVSIELTNSYMLTHGQERL